MAPVRNYRPSGLFSVGVASLLLFSAGALAETEAGKRGIEKGWAKLIGELNLSAEQKAQLKEMKHSDKGDNESRSLRKTLIAETEKLNALVRDKGTDKAKILDQAKKVNDAQAAIRDVRLQKVLKMREILKQEQLSKYLDFMDIKKQGQRKEEARNKPEKILSGDDKSTASAKDTKK